MNFAQLTLTTLRLSLRPFQPSDLETYASYHGKPGVYRYLYSDPPTPAVLVERFRDLQQPRFETTGDEFRLAVVRKADGRLLGEVLLKLASVDARQAEVGYIFDPEQAGQGYATEAVARLITFGFKELGVHRIFARLDVLNQGSIGVVERLGLRREAHFVENDRFAGMWGDEYVYAVLAREWPVAET